MPISADERTVLRDLGKRLADIAALPVHQERAERWAKLNSLQPTRPLIRIFQVPWNEMDVGGELALVTEDPLARGLENGMRQTLYQWEHMQDDLVIEATLYSPYAIHDTGLGISEISDVNRESGIASRRFHEQIHDLRDVEKIRMPEVTLDEQANEERFEQLSELFDGVRPVVKKGISHIWFPPWDQLITWYGVERAMLDMALNPELVNAAVSRLVDAHLHRLEQWEQLNLLSPPSLAEQAGSGGLSLCQELATPDDYPDPITPRDLWGCATPQIFSEVSPEMHWEFALRHEMRWLEKWGLTYYGCCEPLHTKVGILRRIPNLRKISVSPRCNKAAMAEQIRGEYVASLKPNPALLAMDRWDVEVARRELREELRQLEGCSVEIILKDISTVLGEPQRLWEWAQMAQEVAQETGDMG